jgi:hypothetical protein
MVGDQKQGADAFTEPKFALCWAGTWGHIVRLARPTTSLIEPVIIITMQRVVASLPESISELCLIRLGFQLRRISTAPFAIRLARAIDRSAADARATGAGLLHSERFRFAWNHFGVLQYWRGFDELESWSHSSPHSDWWRAAVERGRTKGDFGVYHETFIVPRSSIESIYVDCPHSPGLLSFGERSQPIGPLTNSRSRLEGGLSNKG